MFPCSSMPPDLYTEIFIQQQEQSSYIEMPAQDIYERQQLFRRYKVQALGCLFFTLSAISFFNFFCYKEISLEGLRIIHSSVPLSAKLYLAGGLGQFCLGGYMCLYPHQASISYVVKIAAIVFLILNISALGLASTDH